MAVAEEAGMHRDFTEPLGGDTESGGSRLADLVVSRSVNALPPR